MSRIVSKSKFKPAALKYFRQVEETGEELVISDRGRPVLKIIRYRELESGAPQDPLRRLRDTLLNYDEPFAPVGLEDWEALK